jgi:hypothetical protein
LHNQVDAVNTLFEDKENMQQNIAELTEFYEHGEDLSNKISTLYKSIKTKKDEIESLSYEIFGYEEENEEDGTVQPVKGLKDELNQAYDGLVNDLKEFKNSLSKIEATANTNYDGFIAKKEEKYSSLVKDIENLLPKALTAGLSHAFSEKRELELDEGQKLSKQFNWTIFGLVFVSLIPFGVSIYQLFNGVVLKEVIYDMPRMVLSILPLYIPVIWLAYSTNKKINLSKRLVEEYTHKEVLSKTFEGLSKQIDNIEDEQISFDLKTKLLYNILSVSAENPGKLISDYNKTDHPLMDALDKSAKLNDAIESIIKIPGLSKLAKVLEIKSNRILKKQSEKIEDILDSTEEKI